MCSSPRAATAPLVVGVGEGEMFVASDVAAFIAFTREAVELGQDRRRGGHRDTWKVTDFDGQPRGEGKPYHVDWDLEAAEKGATTGSCARRSTSSRSAVADTLLGRFNDRGELTLDEIRISQRNCARINKIVIVACGTAYYAGLVAKYAIEHWTRIPCEVEIASEFRYRDPIIDPRPGGHHLPVRRDRRHPDGHPHAREQGAKVIAICNTNGSTIPRESDAVIYTHAGPEIGVASTKGFLTQITACYLLGLYLAQERGMKFGDEVASVMAELETMPAKIQEVLDGTDDLLKLAARSSPRRVGAVPGAPCRLPGRPGGRAEAQGDRVPARRGVPRRGAQARPHRPGRGGHPGVRRRAPAGP
jgi:glucosamine--fructose-6-phosphate aminotransferase (isomerizing)